MLSITIPIPSEVSFDEIESDYDLIQTMFEDEIHEILRNSEQIKFLIKLNHEIDIKQSIYDLITSMKLNDLILNKDQMYLPYWLKFSISKINFSITINFYIYWLKTKKTLIDSLKDSIHNIEQPFLYNTLENTKLILSESLSNTDDIINIISEIKELNIINMNISINNLLFKLTKANEGLDDFQYENKDIPTDENNNKNNIHNRTDEIKNENENKSNEEESQYDLFFKCGGFVGDTITDRASVFQAHAIKVNSLAEVNKYKKYLLTQKKIKKATHNISAYRFIDNKSKLFEDYDDDGEDGAGIRILGVLQKMEAMNVFVVVSRWFGGILLHHDRFKRINDSAINLINQHLDIFK